MHNALDKSNLRKGDLAEREALLFMSMVETSPVGTVVLDGRTVLYANPAAREITGVTTDELYERGAVALLECFAPEERNDALRVARSRVEATIKDSKRFHFAPRGGGRKIVDIVALPIFYGERRALRLSIMDRTKQAAAEEALAKSEANLRAIFDNHVLAFILVDRDLKIVEFNHVADALGATLFNARLESGKPLGMFVPESKRTAFKAHVERAMAGESIESRLAYELDGRPRWFEMTYLPVFAESGEVEGVCFSAYDVTDRTLAEEKLRASEERFRKLTQSANDAIIMSDDRDRITFWNEAAERMFGYTKEEAAGITMHETIAPPGKRSVAKPAYDRFARTGEGPVVGSTRELEAVKKDGTRFSVELSVSAVQVGGKWHAIGVIRDITERKKSEERIVAYLREVERQKKLVEEQSEEMRAMNDRLLESERELVKMNADKDKFFSIIAHDLKSPFYGFLGYAQALDEGLAGMPIERAQSIAAKLRASAKNVFELIENLLDWSRAKLGQYDPDPTTFPLRDAVEAAVKALRESAEKKGVQIGYGEARECVIRADRGMIEATLRNLLANAVKFSTRGGTVEISCKPRGPKVAVFVKDEGIGIPEEAQAELFRIDRAYTTAGTDNEKGTGLGLILCKEFVERNGGEIWVESAPGVGSTFGFTVRQAEK
jgi:hypothetical protein